MRLGEGWVPTDPLHRCGAPQAALGPNDEGKPVPRIETLGQDKIGRCFTVALRRGEQAQGQGCCESLPSEL